MHYYLYHTDCYLLNYTDAIGWGVSLWIRFTVIHSFQSNFRSVLKLTQAHEWPIRVSMWIFLSCYIRHSFTIPKGLLLVLYSNGLARYLSLWLVRGHDTCQVGFALIPRLVLVLQTPLLSWGSLGATVGRASAAPFPEYSPLGGVFSGGVIVVSLDLFDLSFGSLPDKQLLIAR